MLSIVSKAALIAAIVFVVALVGLAAWKHSSPGAQQSQQQPVSESGNRHSKNAEQKDDGIFSKFLSGIIWFVRLLDRHNGLVSAIGTLFVALFTGVLVVATAALFYSSEKVANSANKSAQIAEDSLIKLQRASVFVPNFYWNWHPDTGRPGRFWYSFSPIWENSGSTQTKDMTTNVEFAFFASPIPEPFDFPPNKHTAPAIIGPRSTIGGAVGTLTDDQLAEVQGGTKFFYIWGTATYRDIFEGTPVHTTKFYRQVTNVLGNVAHPDTEKVEMRFSIIAHEHNSAD